MIRVQILLLSILFAAGQVAFSQTQSLRKTPLSPEQQLKRFKLAEGFVIELVASEKDGIINPIDLTFDDAGRLWTQTASMYPLDPVTGIGFGQAMKMMKDQNLIAKDPRFKKARNLYTLKERGKDTIQIIDHLANLEKSTVTTWAEGLAIPQSIMPYKDGCYVAHGSELFFMRDKDGDGKQDSVEPVLSGFGFFDTHTMSHSIVRAPGGWFNFSHGAINSGNVKIVKTGKELNVTYCKNLRFSNDGKALEILNCWRDNVWGYQLRANGQWYCTSANDGGYSVLPIEDQMCIAGIGGEKIRPYQPYFPPIHKFRVGGTGISGLAFSEDGTRGYPKKWQDVAFLANPITGTINSVKISRNDDGSVPAEHLEDLLVCEDDWFRPVNIEFGPDGCLYIADWYNQIVSHNEVSTDHPDRDRSHGRIWRVRHNSQKLAAIPNLIETDNKDLVAHLKAEILWEKRAALHQIVDRQATELIPELVQLISESNDNPVTTIHALWCLEGLKQYQPEVINDLLKSDFADVRREAVRSLAAFGVTAAQAAKQLTPLIDDPNCLVRSQVIRTIEELGGADQSVIDLLISACKPAAPDDSIGGNYERNFERFLARKALESFRPELMEYINSEAAAKQSPDRILWASQALSENEMSAAFVAIWNRASMNQEIDDNTFVSITQLLDRKEISTAVAPLFSKNKQAMLAKALRLYDRINGPAVASIYAEKIKTDLASDDINKVSSALNTVSKLRAKEHTKQIIDLASSAPSNKMPAMMDALAVTPNVPIEVYQKSFLRDDLDFAAKLNAFAALVMKNQKLAITTGAEWVKQLSDNEKTSLVNRLSYSREGASVIRKLNKSKVLPTESWNYFAAQRALKPLRRDSAFQKLAKNMMNEQQESHAKRKQQIHNFAQAYTEKSGNAETGKIMFNMCLACHKVGELGQELAPSLDGSANRDIEHLITAIVDPDAAVEGAYGLYYVARKDGKVIEGYMKRKNDNGTTIGLPGGATIFTHRSLIAAEGNDGSRSFMPSGYGEFPEQTMLDLVAYIKTLK